MPLSTATQNSKFGQSVAASFANVSAGNDVNIELEEDEEEEDVDFNPFLREEISSEASSGLSSENEDPGDSVDGNLQCSVECKDASASQQCDERQGYNFCAVSGDGETVMRTRLEEAYRTDAVPGNRNNLEPTSSIHQEESLICPLGSNKLLSSGDKGDATDELTKEELLTPTEISLNPRNSQKPITHIDDGDAICRRTRARHSLANYTLEELETFLQESDDDGNLQNVNDEEEYRKFLSAVLLEGIDDGQIGQEDGNLDEDEENDADFVIEIEEALESDVDESLDITEGRNGKLEVDAHRPETRQKKRLKQSTVNRYHPRRHTKMPVRPVLPYVRNAQTACFPTPGRQFLFPKSFSHCSSSQLGAVPVNGFTDNQIGQLYCLMHEHVQLLIQVFSVCVLDPSRQQVATEARKMISEMVDKREEALARKKVPYPGLCFHPQSLHSSLHFNLHQTVNCSFWTPLTDKPVLSVLDVAPLALAKSYMTDVSATVLRNRQGQLEDVGDRSHMKKKTLFPLPTSASSNEPANYILGGTLIMSPTAVQPVSPGQQQHKKSLAASLVESTKKQSVALVPHDIAELALRFYPLFNPTLFPHKPPVPAVVSRVLFTDAEDGLLAMGIMEYNNDWMSIQRRFLPCKSQHQIFIRQKNRSSSKASENPIKAVRRMKNSPLTADEISRIHEGLKLFKHDWIPICKYFVPHRDPSLLPRQWRIATGTQKSYKKTDAFREKRRLYETKRRRLKASITDLQTSTVKEVGYEENTAGAMDDEGEAYVHEAFLADTEPRSSKHLPCDVPLSSINKSNMQLTNMMSYTGTDVCEKGDAVTSQCGEPQQQSVAMHEVVTSSKPSGDTNPLSRISHVRHTASLNASSEKLSSNSISQAPKSHLGSWSCHMHKGKGVRVVKLAADLPPVNLPRSVRVLSQSAFKTFNKGSSSSKTGDSAMKKHQHGLPQVPSEGTTTAQSGNHVNIFPDNGPQINSRHDERLLADQCAAEETISESDLYMHPLLFQAADQSSSYYSMRCTASGTYNFFPELPLPSESDLLMHQNSVRSHIDRTSRSEVPPLNLITIDFHPLLQRADNVSGDYAFKSTGRLSADSQTLQGNCDEFLNPSGRVLREAPIGDNDLATDTAYPSHREKDKLNLDISLCSAPDQQKTARGILLNKHQLVEESIPTLQHIVVENGLHDDKLYINHRDKCPEDSVATNSSIRSKACPKKNLLSLKVVLPNNAGACQYPEDSHDESVPEIVMEQEELSDSEEEIQLVEFEREEMDDSEGEGLNSEQPTQIQTKELLISTAEEAGIRGIHDLNLMPQSSYPTQESTEEGNNYMSQTGVISQDPSQAKLSWLKPRNQGAKRGRLCKSSVNEPCPRPRRHLRSVGECESIASRKPRKRSSQR